MVIHAGCAQASLPGPSAVSRATLAVFALAVRTLHNPACCRTGSLHLN